MKTNLLFCLVGLCLVTLTINLASSEELEQKPLHVEELDLAARHHHVEKSQHRGYKKLPAGGVFAIREEGPFSLWYSIYANNPVDIMIMKDHDYQAWLRGGRKDPHYINNWSNLRTKDSEAKSATVLDDGDYWVVIYNNKKWSDKTTVVDYEIRFQKTSEGLPVWVVVLLCVGLFLLLGVCLVGSLFFGMREHRTSYVDREWGWRDTKPSTENKTTWKVSASKGIHDPERQPLNQ